MKSHNLGYPRIGAHRELKKACEQYWAGKIDENALRQTGQQLRHLHWATQQRLGIDLIPCNDFSYYDQVLDTSLMLGAIPARFKPLQQKELKQIDLYFAMARGYQREGTDLKAMEMTKWFDTNYHYIVPEFYAEQKFELFSTKIIDETQEALAQGIPAKPILLGPVSYLLLGKEKGAGFDKIELLADLAAVYVEVLKKLQSSGVEWVQIDEPCLVQNLSPAYQDAISWTYHKIQQELNGGLKILLATYFEGLGANLSLALDLPIQALHLDLQRAPEQLETVLHGLPTHLELSLGLVDGRNIWKNDLSTSLIPIEKVLQKMAADRVWIAPSCSLLHVPNDLNLEKDEKILSTEIKQWLAFAQQKLEEIVLLKKLAAGDQSAAVQIALAENQQAIQNRKTSALIHHNAVKERVKKISTNDKNRQHPFLQRKPKQQQALQLPLFPTTTIGSFPQTNEVRIWRAKFKKGELNAAEYQHLLEEETRRTIAWQESIGLDVLVHGEFERNDMVEYFGEQLAGFAFTQHAWVQSYGSRCVKPPIIYGDVYRLNDMTVSWSVFAQSLTEKLVKGMLTGPVTILQWSFVRDDQPRADTCTQIALAIRDEVVALEKAGIKVIQIDEPAIREGLPLRQANWEAYLQWAVDAFRIATSVVQDETQIHTHMCYSEFNDILPAIAAMDADVITIECSRSQMELLDAFQEFNYPNEIGPGVYDIHSARIPSTDEMVELLEKAEAVLATDQIWVNPDCGLKTRHWDETEKALEKMVQAAQSMRDKVTSNLV